MRVSLLSSGEDAEWGLSPTSSSVAPAARGRVWNLLRKGAGACWAGAPRGGVLYCPPIWGGREGGREGGVRCAANSRRVIKTKMSKT